MQKVKIDISKRNFGASYELLSLYGIGLKVMVQEDMFANKIVASLERQSIAIRDLFDIHYMFSQLWSYNSDIITRRTKQEAKEILKLLLQKIQKLSFHNILADIGSLLDAKQKHWVKNQLQEDLILQLKIQTD